MTTALRDYFNRSGDTELGVGWYVENEHGFCVWRRQDEKLILVNVYGDGKYWDNWADEMAKELGLETVFFATQRNPAGFVRKYNYEVTGYILERKASWVV